MYPSGMDMACVPLIFIKTSQILLIKADSRHFVHFHQNFSNLYLVKVVIHAFFTLMPHSSYTWNLKHIDQGVKS